MSKFQLTTARKILIALAVIVLVALIGLAVWYMITHPTFTAAVSDMAVIVLAIVVLLMNIFLIMMLWQIIRLINFLITEMKPVLESLQQTSTTVRGTAEFVSEGVATPIIDASAKAAGVKGSLRYLVNSLTNPKMRTKRAGQAPLN